MDIMISHEVAAIQVISTTKKLIVNLKVKLTPVAITKVIKAISEATGLNGLAVLEYDIKLIKK